jgi:transcriptional regulator with XRE-family HTH domain
MSGHGAFGTLLRDYRAAANLTQEELAERSGMSVQAIGALERGDRRSPRPSTVEYLAEALKLDASRREALVAAARGRPVPTVPSRQLPDLAPEPLTSLIGRKAELAGALHLLGQGGSRLLTLAGPPGVGKTRLGQAVGVAARDRFPDGVVFVSLASLSQPDLVGTAIKQSLRLQTQSRAPLLKVLTNQLRSKRLLLILDNFEHVLPAAPLLTDLLGACPALRVLVTSRTVLRIRGEQVLLVPPLPVPDPGRPAPARVVIRVPSVALFVERARARRPGFVMTDADSPAVAELCRRLDGLPLAIELAAGWIGVLNPPALDWSYDLLDSDEQATFRRFSVFAGGASLQAIGHVCRGGRPVDPLDLVASLVDKHLLVREAGGAETRVSMLHRSTSKSWAGWSTATGRWSFLLAGGAEVAARRSEGAMLGRD